MREMHKWKDKVEVSLDNRQIFFLFFGLSVVGCFVFALGVMVGRRVDWNAEGQVAALAGDSLAVLDDSAAPSPDGAPAFTFADGLKQSATLGVPQTRTQQEAEADASEAGTAADASSKPSAEATLVASSPATKPKLPQGRKTSVDPTRSGRTFTLQMKAFSREDEATVFADRLRRNGHDVRIEATEVRGRLWHRVRMGSFKQWDKALAAKTDFEKSEHIIAYVVRE